LFLLFNVPGWLGKGHQWWTGVRQVAPGFLVASPGRAVTLADDALYFRQPRQFWSALLCSHLIGWCLIATASGLVLRSWQDRATTVRGARWETWRQRWSLGTPAARVAFRQRWLAINP